MALLVFALRRAASSLAPTCPAPPPCRARHPPGRRGTRVVCCAPAPGTRPPCAPPAPAASLTCRDASDQNCASLSSTACPPGIQPSVKPPNGWVCDQDPVARRLQVARSVRRAHYEWEVACRAAAPPPPPCCPALYMLGGERECARATDGCTYAVLPDAAAPAHCGPGRTPPPLRCVELAPDDACRIRGNVHLDPCAHRPRILIQIDRSASQITCPANPPSPCPAPFPAPWNLNPAAPCPAKPPAPCPAKPPTPSPAPSTAPWNLNPPVPCPANTPAPCPASPSAHCPEPCPTPSRCQRLTIIERLRAHVPGCQSVRRTHTSSALSIPKKSSEYVSGGLDGVLRSKEQLNEAGLGRFVTDVEAGPGSPDKPTGGRLELSVPPGTDHVAVHVSLSRATHPPPLAASASGNAPSNSSSCEHFDSTSEKRNPCLSINQIRRKWTGQYDQKSAHAQWVGAAYARTSLPARGPTTPSSGPGTPQSSSSATPCGPGMPQTGSSATPCGPGMPQSGSAATPCVPAVPPSCKSRASSTKPSNEPKTKQCSSTSAFMANTIVANS